MNVTRFFTISMAEHHTFHDSKEGAEQPEHTTHVPAVVILVLITAVVAAVVAVYSQPTQQSPSQAINRPANQNEPDAVSYIPAEEMSNTNDLPAEIFFGQHTVVQNRMLNLSGKRQRIIVYDTGLAPEEVSGQYQSWFQQNGFSIEEQSSTANGGSFTATRNGQRAVVVFGQKGNPDGARVQFNYVMQSGI
jgi:hypothetical protein